MRMRLLILSLGLLLCGAFFSGSALADSASTAPFGLVSGAQLGGLTSGVSPTAVTPDIGTTYYCYTVPDEPCYLIFNAGVGTTLAVADFSESPSRNVLNKCVAPYKTCTFEDEAIPSGDTNVVLDWYVSGPDVRDVEVF